MCVTGENETLKKKKKKKKVFGAEATAGAPDMSVSLSCPELDNERKESVD